MTSLRHLPRRRPGGFGPLGCPVGPGLVAAAACVALLAAGATAARAGTAGAERATGTTAGAAWRSGSPSAGRLAARLRSVWGGPTVASNGETVQVEISDSYPEDPAFARRWADEVVALLHGPELASVRVLLGTLEEVQSVCGD